jgi:hypothetical protein
MIFIKAQKYVYVCMYYRSQAKKRKRNMIKFINPNTKFAHQLLASIGIGYSFAFLNFHTYHIHNDGQCSRAQHKENRRRFGCQVGFQQLNPEKDHRSQTSVCSNFGKPVMVDIPQPMPGFYSRSAKPVTRNEVSGLCRSVFVGHNYGFDHLAFWHHNLT